MLAHYLFISVIGLYLLLVLLWILIKRHRSRLLVAFSIICWLTLLPVGLLSQFSLYSKPVEVQITNYSPRKGHLYFFKSAECSSRILYDLAVNGNEESSLEVEGDGDSFDKVVFRTENGQLFEFPFDDQQYRVLDIWEKELQLTDNCYQSSIQSYRRRQLLFAMAIGLLMLGTFGMLGAGIRK